MCALIITVIVQFLLETDAAWHPVVFRMCMNMGVYENGGYEIGVCGDGCAGNTMHSHACSSVYACGTHNKEAW